MFEYKNFPSPADLKAELPLENEERAFIEGSRKAAQEIASGRDGRLAIITGPCSIHEIEGALDYARELKKLSLKIEESSFLVMRVYVEKSRTGVGWKGLLYDPHLDGSSSIEAGLRLSRQLFIELAKLRVPIAVEFVDPLVSLYFDDLITWGFIGARTSYSQPHRQLASSLPFPIGFKNGLDGDLDQTLHSILSSKAPHTFLYVDNEGKLAPKQSSGNPCSHLVLRGSLSGTNYDEESVNRACESLKEQSLSPRLLIDCAHGNSQKDYEKQKEVFAAVIQQVQKGSDRIMGVMLESHLHAGSQRFDLDGSPLKYGISITDPCLDWISTEELILSTV
ncbi:MAG: 3-deoxy-7-phosphoheptulonate synthase [Chlamydiales bacterium]|nr:3-deoxy-7-phosphoheptulonate synthase [Chlamydiales bacterium]